MIDYLVSVLTEGSIFAIMALGLNIIWGGRATLTWRSTAMSRSAPT